MIVQLVVIQVVWKDFGADCNLVTIAMSRFNNVCELTVSNIHLVIEILFVISLLPNSISL